MSAHTAKIYPFPERRAQPVIAPIWTFSDVSTNYFLLGCAFSFLISATIFKASLKLMSEATWTKDAN